MFANFIEAKILGGTDAQELRYYSTIAELEWTKARPRVLTLFTPLKESRAFPPNSDGIDISSKRSGGADRELPERGISETESGVVLCAAFEGVG